MALAHVDCAARGDVVASRTSLLDHGGSADGEGAGRDDRVVQHHRIRRNDRSRTDPHPMQYDGPRGDLCPVLHDAALEMDDVADDTVVAHDGRVLGGRVQDRIVLDARTGTDHDPAVVPAQDRSGPDRRLGADLYGADDDRVRMDEGGWIDAWLDVTECVDGHDEIVPPRVDGDVAPWQLRRHGLPYALVSRRLDIEVTSLRQDGTYTWRAAGAREPRGTGETSGLPAGIAVGDVVRAEIEAHLDGMTVLSVTLERAKERRVSLLEMKPVAKEFKGVTEQRAERPKRRERSERPRRPVAGPDATKRPARRAFVPPPEVPRRPSLKRLRAGRAHRDAVLATLPEDQRAVAETVLAGGRDALRTAIKQQNERHAAEGKPLIDEKSLDGLATSLQSRLQLAEWRDRADAALSQADRLDLRDMRAVVSSADKSGVQSTPESREVLERLRAELRRRETEDMGPWLAEIEANLTAGRVVRALHLAGEPPKLGQPFPSELGQRLATAASAALRPDELSPRWIRVLEAAAFSPVRTHVTVGVVPPQPADDLLATVRRLGPLLPQIAQAFQIEVAPNASRPRPLRPERRERKRPARAKSGRAPTDVQQNPDQSRSES